MAKRLIDYGFHAPTMSFPVAGTLMIEPTESEDLAELDRFCDAMIAIRGEIDAGRLRRVRPAPTTRCATPRTRPTACVGRRVDRTPTAAPRRPTRCRRCADGKYWPPVRRIDQAYGDRNLVCSCPPLEAYED